MKRRKTRQITIGDVPIGGVAPIVIQSMTKTDTRDVKATVSQIKRLEKNDCEIVRVAVPDKEAVEAIGQIVKKVSIPVIADIHFDYRLALLSLKKGVQGLRINPGNIGSREKVTKIVLAAKEREVPIRIGVNSGSLEKELLKKYEGVTPDAMVESALNQIRIFEDLDFSLIKVSLKSFDIEKTLASYRLLAEKVDYPFHAGITEAGGWLRGTVRSSVGLTLLLYEGLADTIRVSLTAPPEEEVRVGYNILTSLGLRQYGPTFISCPICGRCEVNLFKIASEIEKQLSNIKQNISIAVMGCMVNGPGEAKEADIGIACGQKAGVIFKKGQVYRRVKEDKIVEEFVKEVHEMVRQNKFEPRRG